MDFCVTLQVNNKVCAIFKGKKVDVVLVYMYAHINI